MAFSAYDTLYQWARRTTSSFFADLRFVPSASEDAQDSGDSLVYRLRHWPDLPARHRTAAVYRALSLMSNRPVNRAWFIRHAHLDPLQLDRLLASLLAQGAIEVVDVSAFRDRA